MGKVPITGRVIPPWPSVSHLLRKSHAVPCRSSGRATGLGWGTKVSPRPRPVCPGSVPGGRAGHGLGTGWARAVPSPLLWHRLFRGSGHSSAAPGSAPRAAPKAGCGSVPHRMISQPDPAPTPSLQLSRLCQSSCPRCGRLSDGCVVRVTPPSYCSPSHSPTPCPSSVRSTGGPAAARGGRAAP